jgi:PEP-CTERM motif
MKRIFARALPIFALSVAAAAMADSVPYSPAITYHQYNNSADFQGAITGAEKSVTFPGSAASCQSGTFCLSGSVGGFTAIFSSSNSGGKDADPLAVSYPSSSNPLKYRITTGNDSDTSIDNFGVTIENGTFGDLFINIYGVFSGSSTTPILFTMTDGRIYSGYLNLLEGDSANNYLAFYAPTGEQFSSIIFGAPDPARFYGVSDIYFSDVTPAAAPEPTSLSLLGTGLLGGFGALRRKYSR